MSLKRVPNLPKVTNLANRAFLPLCALVLVANIGCKPRTFNASKSKSASGSSLGNEYVDVAPLTGRLILPKDEAGERRPDGGVFFEVHNTNDSRLAGKTVWLRFDANSQAGKWSEDVKVDVRFTADSQKSIANGNVLPTRLDGKNKVSALESLAGGRAADDMHVMIKNIRPENIKADSAGATSSSGMKTEFVVEASSEPVQISGDKMALVKFSKTDAADPTRATVTHYNPASKDFSGKSETLEFSVLPKPEKSAVRFTIVGVEKESSINSQGWYLYGNVVDGKFVVKAMEPRALMQVKKYDAGSIRYGVKASESFIDNENFGDVKNQKQSKGKIASTLLHPFDMTASPSGAADGMSGVDESVLARYKEGTRGIVVHVFGGIGGTGGDAPAPAGLVTGHFSFGIATVVKDPITSELRFDVEYKQIYAQSPDGIVSGSAKWHNFMGDFVRGWANVRPVSDGILFHPALSTKIKIGNLEFSALDGFSGDSSHWGIEGELEKMSARFRTGSGDGLSVVNAVESCVQDSNQALFLLLSKFYQNVQSNPASRDFVKNNPRSADVQKYNQLLFFADDLYKTLTVFGKARSDWKRHAATDTFEISSSKDGLFATLRKAVMSWKTVLPRSAHDEILKTGLHNNVDVWILRTNQIGGWNPDIFPQAPVSKPSFF